MLLAEDNEVNQKVALSFLERLGVTADVVANGHDAVELVSNGEYDVVLMDVQMPEMDGLSATRSIRSAPGPQPAIVALTAGAMPDERRRCLDAGMDGYLSKPLRLYELQQVLEEAGRKRERLPAADNRLAQLLEEVGGDRSLVDDTVSAYVDGTAAKLEQLHVACADPDLERIGRLAHDLVSTSALVGAHDVAAAATRIELAAWRGSVDDAWAGLEAATAAMAPAVARLRGWQAELDLTPRAGSRAP